MGDAAEGEYGLNTQYYPGTISLITVEMPTDSYPGSGFEGAYFNLSVNKNLSFSQCVSIDSQNLPSGREGTTTIGGIAFRWGGEGGVGAGQSSYGKYYTGYANGTCYEFNLGDAGGSNVSLSGVPGPSYAGDMSVLEALLSSVDFTGQSSSVLKFTPPNNVAYEDQTYSATVSPCFVPTVYNPEYGVAEINPASSSQLVPGADVDEGGFVAVVLDDLGNTDFHCDKGTNTEIFDVVMHSEGGSFINTNSLPLGTVILFVANEDPGSDYVAGSRDVLAVSAPFELLKAQ